MRCARRVAFDDVAATACGGGDIRGGQFQGSGKLVTVSVTVTANATTTDNKVLSSAVTATCP